MNTMARHIMTTHLLREIAICFSMVFFTLYVWKTADLQAVAVFWMATFFFLPLVFLALGPVVKKRSRLIPMQAGLALAALFFFFLFVLKEASINYLIPLAALSAAYNGLHWLSFNTLAFDANDPGTRGKFYGTIRAAARVIQFAGPVVGGALIVWDPLGIDYMLVFGLSCLFFVFAFFGSLTITKTPAIKVKSDFSFLTSLKKFIKNPDYRNSFSAIFMKGFCYRGASKHIILLLFFITTGNEAYTGGFAGILALVAAVSALWMSRQKEPNHQRLAWIGAAGYFSGTMLFVLWPGFWTLIAFSIILYFFDAFIDIPQIAIGQNILNKHKALEYRVEYMVLREFGIDLGRIVGYGVLFLVATLAFDSVMLRGLVLAMGTGVLALVWFLSRIHFPKHLARLPAN